MAGNSKNQLMLDALSCKNRSRPPVWFMRQAGRCLPQYRALREKYSLLELFHHPELIAEITLLPVKVLDVDAAILFSDILVVLEAFGIRYDFQEGVGPVLHSPLKSSHDIKALCKRDVKESLGYVEKAIHLLIPQLNVPLLGFCGAPFTIASYLIEGGSSREFKKTKQWLYEDPDSFHHLLEKITEVLVEYLKLQIHAGVSAIQIFDSWANILGYRQFKQCSLNYLKHIIDQLKESRIPIILFCRSSSLWAQELVELGPSAISLDWNSHMASIRKQVGGGVALQGNLDPAIFYGSDQFILSEARHLLQTMHKDPGFICNLGHGMLPDVSVDKIRLLVECVKEQ